MGINIKIGAVSKLINSTTSGSTTDQTTRSGVANYYTKTEVDTTISSLSDIFAPTTHSHSISDVTGLQAALDNKLEAVPPISLDTLSDVNITSPATGQVLTFNGTDWVSQDVATQSIDTSQFANANHSHTISEVTGLQAALDSKLETVPPISLGTLSDVNITAPVDSDVLSWDQASSSWIGRQISSTGGATQLSDLSDVTVTTPQIDHVISWDGTKWINKALSTSGGSSGSTNPDWARYVGTVTQPPTGGSTSTFIIGNRAKGYQSGYSILIGDYTETANRNNQSNDRHVVIGYKANAYSTTDVDKTVVIGAYAGSPRAYLSTVNISYNGAVMIGYGCQVDGTWGGCDYGVAVGMYAKLRGGKYGVAIGYGARVDNQYSVAIGANVTNSITHSAKVGSSNQNALHIKNNGQLNLLGSSAGYVVPGYNTGSEPTNVPEGTLIFDKTTKKMKFYNGTTWETIQSS